MPCILSVPRITVLVHLHCFKKPSLGTRLNNSLKLCGDVFSRGEEVWGGGKEKVTSGSAAAEGLCDALCQSKSCQVLHNCTNNL